jgi:phosphoribosyl-ATP pyrophosphohydrolase/phosphoribosyl-AMP cyclohydrolase
MTGMDEVKWDERGLAPAIVQEATTGEVLMMAYMNRDSLRLSLDSGETHFWSRSRQMLWHKGETSGNIQKIKEIRLDCDGDVLLVLVEQTGVACHTGARSCFFRELTGDGTRAAGGAPPPVGMR